MFERIQGHRSDSRSSDRAFGFVMAGACAVFGAMAWWKNPVSPWVYGLAVAGVVFLGLALFWVAPLKPLNVVWAKLGELLHKVVSPLVMGLMFFAVITPIGLVMRLAGKDPLCLRLDPDAASYWVARDDEAAQSSTMTQQF